MKFYTPEEIRARKNRNKKLMYVSMFVGVSLLVFAITYIPHTL
ncbi:hypothetical protein [Bacillus coahuilensis]|nr:hypothetical protein [Bacillus coahuilensis]